MLRKISRVSEMKDIKKTEIGLLEIKSVVSEMNNAVERLIAN